MDTLLCRVISSPPQDRNHFEVVLVLAGVTLAESLMVGYALRGCLLRQIGWMGQSSDKQEWGPRT